MSILQNTLIKFVSYNQSCKFLWPKSFNTSILNSTPKKTIEEKLGIQRRPKRPLTVFLSFVSDRRPILTQQNPSAKLTDIMKMLSEEWKNLDQKKKDELQEKFKRDWVKYIDDCKKYDETLSPGVKEQIKLSKEEAKFLQAKKNLKKKREQLGCPKKPGSSYMYFMKTRLPHRGDEPFLDFQRKVKEDWEVLPPLEKKKYEEMYKKDIEEYREKMAAWNKQMLEKGNKDVVRTP